jgi:hypothetical protein
MVPTFNSPLTHGLRDGAAAAIEGAGRTTGRISAATKLEHSPSEGSRALAPA